MATVASGTKFPSFQQSKDYFSDGIGSAPEFKLTDAPAPGIGGESAPGLDTPPAGAGAVTPPAAPPAAPSAPPPTEPVSTPAGQTLKDPTPGVGSPYNLEYQQTGSLEERLFDPISGGVETGGQQLEDFASQFLTEAGPERTYEGIGAEGQLAGAVAGTTSTDVGKALVGAQYEGPAGLDPGGVGYLTDLARQLLARQTMLSTGGGLTTAVQQSTPGLTPGESRFQAKSMFGEGFRDVVPEMTAGVGQFTGALDAETQAAIDYATARTGQEADIASQSRDYLTGRSDVISSDLEQAVADAKAKEAETLSLWDQIQGGGETADIVGYLKQLQDAGSINFAGTGGAGVGPEGQPLGPPDVGNILSDIYGQGEAARAREAEIMAKYPELAGIAPLGQDFSGSGRGTLTYTAEGPGGETQDYRSLYDPGTRGELTQRQRELEKEFDPMRLARGQEAPGAAFNPLYGGEGFEGPDVKDYLGFEPSIRPSRENLSSEEQRTQINNINEMLGKLDRISEAKTPFHAAMIYAQIDSYLADEEASLAEHTGEMTKEAKEWRNLVNSTRKRARKNARKKEYGKIGGAIGAGIGTLVGRGQEGEKIGAGVGPSFA